MGQEIERKFLVADDGWRADVERSVAVTQGYLALTDRAVIRVRIVDDATATLTIKSAASGAVRDEFEYAIPLDDARALLALHLGRLIEKRRHIVRIAGARWEIDVFAGDHQGLVLAEIELADAASPIDPPPWLGREVTGEARYYNARLASTDDGV